MFIAILITAVLVHFRLPIFNRLKWAGGFIGGFIATGCLALLLMPLFIAILCRLSLWIMFG